MTGPDLLREVADTLLTLDYQTWDFGDSVAFEGLVAASDALSDDRYLAFAHGWARAWATRATPYRRLDCTAPGSAMVEIHRRTGDARLIEALVGLADYLLGRPVLESGLFATWEHSPLRHPYGPDDLDAHGAYLIADPPPGAFIDCLHFDPPFLTALGATTGETRFSIAGAEQARRYVGRLQQPDGLFDHFELRGESRTYGYGWGRGQGWALLGLLDTLSEISEMAMFYHHRNELETAVRNLVDGMVSLQLDGGHWATNVRDPHTGIENSTAAFMAVGFRRAVRSGIIDNREWKRVLEAADRAETAVVDSLSPNRTLGVSAAVMACTTNTHYDNVPTGFVVPWGQGPVALMLAETENR
ncbi:glycoside hydrolase family 88 protein [Leifsonia sp. 22587]|uniref:glycoside hydrolase family 88 protein n=1 Tax=Leifsonia sp. 22587 TaxID=3453946 RepID=UPI003F85725E